MEVLRRQAPRLPGLRRPGQINFVFSDLLLPVSMVTPMVQLEVVCTDSHVTVRTMLMKSVSLKVTILSLKGIKFLIICDREGDSSRAVGMFKLSCGKFWAASGVLFCFCFATGFCHTGGCARP